MKLFSNCHTHTDFCDGKSSAADTVVSALELGFVSLGFSGHSPLPYESGYAMTPEGMADYIKQVRQLRQRYKDKLDILCGIEWDNDTGEDFRFSDFDFCLGAVHQLHGDEIYPIDLSAEVLSDCVRDVFAGSWLNMAKKYYELVYYTACVPEVDIVAHFDLITKFNTVSRLFDEDDPKYQGVALECLDGIIDRRPELVFEVNTGAMNRAKKSGAYPAPFLLKRLNERGARVTVTSDCHSADSLTFGFDRALEQCRAAKIKSVYILKSSGFEEISIIE